MREIEPSIDKNKLLSYLFLNLAYILKKSRATIKYETPLYGKADLGFAITMVRIDHKAYDYATQCFRLMGRKPVRECGVTMSVSFDTLEECKNFKPNFMSLMDEANDKLEKTRKLTPQEHYTLKTTSTIQKNISHQQQALYSLVCIVFRYK